MSRLRVGGEWRNTLCRFLLSLTLVFIVQWTNTVRWCGLLPGPFFHYRFVTSEYFSHFSLSYSCSCGCCLWNAANSNNKVDIIMGRLSFLQNIHLNLQESGNLSSDQFDIPGLVSLLAMYLYKAFLFVFYFFPFWNHLNYVCFVCSMVTPNGRFMTQKKICLSMSDCKCFWSCILVTIACCFERIPCSWPSIGIFIASQFTQRVGTLCGLCQGNKLQYTYKDKIWWFVWK